MRQGCILSPILFYIYSVDNMREALDDFDGGVKFGGTKVTNLRYVHDTLLICNSRHKLFDSPKTH